MTRRHVIAVLVGGPFDGQSDRLTDVTDGTLGVPGMVLAWRCPDCTTAHVVEFTPNALEVLSGRRLDPTTYELDGEIGGLSYRYVVQGITLPEPLLLTEPVAA